MAKSLKDALELFTKALKKVQKFKDDNKDIMDKYLNLVEDRLQAEEALKTISRSENTPIENDYVSVKISQPFKKWYDYNTAWKLANPEEKELIATQATISEIDKEKFKQLVEEGKIRKEIMQKSFKEEAQTPRITVQVKET